MRSRADRIGHRGNGLALRLVLLASAFFVAGCGYHVAGHASHLPSEWTQIAIPAFKNDTTTYRIEQRMTEAVIREFTTRTKYRVVQDPQSADGVLHGEILSIETDPMLFNATTGEVTTMLVTVHTKVELIDTKTDKPVYKNDDMVFRDRVSDFDRREVFFEEAGSRARADVARSGLASCLQRAGGFLMAGNFPRKAHRSAGEWKACRSSRAGGQRSLLAGDVPQ